MNRTCKRCWPRSTRWAIRAAGHRVLLDSNHGAGSILGKRLLEALGCQVVARRRHAGWPVRACPRADRRESERNRGTGSTGDNVPLDSAKTRMPIDWRWSMPTVATSARSTRWHFAFNEQWPMNRRVAQS